MPRSRVGTRIRFADGSEAVIYRETTIDGATARNPCVLEVCFRLRLVRGRAHRLFRWESMANTPLFVGFPGFVSKLWVSHDAAGRYRGLYQWDGPDRAVAYARALWWVLALVSERRSIRYHVVPHLGRDEWLDSIAADGNPADDPDPDPAGDQWWRVVGLP